MVSKGIKYPQDVLVCDSSLHFKQQALQLLKVAGAVGIARLTIKLLFPNGACLFECFDRELGLRRPNDDPN